MGKYTKEQILKAAEQMRVCETWAGVPAKKIGMNKKYQI